MQRKKKRAKDREETKNQSKKGPEKDQPSSSVVNHSQSLFKMELKVDINSYQSEIDTQKLNHQFRQLQAYSSVHHVKEEQNISFARRKLEGHALTWWEIHMETLRLEGDHLMTKWVDFKSLIKSQFYLIGYAEDRCIQWKYFSQIQGKSVQEYATKFKKMAIMLGISPKSPNVLLKYLGGLHSHV